MDWNAAIDHNREALKRILALLLAMAGFAALPSLRGGDAHGPVRAILPRHRHRAVLRLLRPAEAAARRLVIVAAGGIVVALAPPRSRKAKAGPSFVRNGIGTGIVLRPGRTHRSLRPAAAGSAAAARRHPGFALFDPPCSPLARRRPTSSGVPRIWAPGCRDPIAVPGLLPSAPDDPVDATRLGLRLAALASVLDDMPTYARRFARWRARIAGGGPDGDSSDTAPARSRFRRLRPLRPGPPPGSPSGNSRRPLHEVHEILARAHGLAFCVLERRDTS